MFYIVGYGLANGVGYAGMKAFLQEAATVGRVETARPEDMVLLGANWEAFSPVNTSRKGLPSKISRFLWSTFGPQGYIFPKLPVCKNTVEVWLRYLFKTSRSWWAEASSKSPTNFRCKFASFRWIEISKTLAMVCTSLRPAGISNMQGSCKSIWNRNCIGF